MAHMDAVFDVLPIYILYGSIALTYFCPTCYNEELHYLPLAVLLCLGRSAHHSCSGGEVVIIIIDHSLSLKRFRVRHLLGFFPFFASVFLT